MGSAYGAAELLIPPPNPRFPIQYIYASNRNIGQVMDDRGDSIAIFQYTFGQLKLVNQFFTGLYQVRSMQFGGKNDEYLVAAGATGNGGVAIFKRVERGRNFAEITRNLEIPTRASFVWV